MNELERTIENMDFPYFATGQHKIEPESFLKSTDAVLLDVRSKEEMETIKFQLKHHAALLEIPAHEVPSRIDEIPQDKFIGVFCSSGIRCVMIFLYLQSKGYKNVKILEGGYNNLIAALMPGKIHKHLNNN
jgi:rhodanese-related sulfurtransferase